MERALELGALTFNDSPTIAWNFDNCVLDEDNMGNCKPMKGNGDSGKIDGVIAALQAFGVAIQQVRHAVK
jgi:phage terminase large subunit-like protein